MKIEKQVCTLEQAKRLKELGVNQKSLFYFHQEYQRPMFGQTINGSTQICNQKDLAISAFSNSELGVMFLEMPTTEDGAHSTYTVYFNGFMGCWTANVTEYEIDDDDTEPSCHEMPFIKEYTEAAARAALGLHLLKIGAITAEQVNERLVNA